MNNKIARTKKAPTSGAFVFDKQVIKNLSWLTKYHHKKKLGLVTNSYYKVYFVDTILNTFMEPNTPETTQSTTSTTDTVIKDMRINTDWLITLAFAFFLGCFGVHRFYNGKIGTGILMIFTLGGFGIWITIDIIMILFGKFTKKDGTIIPVRVPVQ